MMIFHLPCAHEQQQRHAHGDRDAGGPVHAGYPELGRKIKMPGAVAPAEGEGER